MTRDGEKRKALVLKEKERGRSLLTELGRLDISRDYYYDKKDDLRMSTCWTM